MDKVLKESEKVLERKLNKWVKEAGGMSVKLGAQYHGGLPDRMLLLPNSKIFFCELKTTGQTPTPLQRVTHKLLRGLGFKVYVVDSSDLLSQMIKTELL